MGILGKKKNQRAPSDDDFKKLDKSVSELSEQTSALLTHFGEKNVETAKNTKSTSSNRNSIKRQPGRSFDIIQGSRKGSQKEKKNRSTPTIIDEGIELLPEHAGKSFNEVEPTHDNDIKTVETVNDKAELKTSSSESIEDSTSANPAIVIGHAVGSLRVNESEDESAEDTKTIGKEVSVQPKVDAQTEENEKKDIAEDDNDEQMIEADSESDAKKATAWLDDTSKEDAPVDLKESGGQPQTDDQSEKEESIEVDKPKTEAPETKSDTGEVFASNLVSNEPPKGYEQPEGQQQPSVFDTNEYHPELHDWSKLDHSHSGKWYVLALLIAIAAALAYFVFSGQKLPFVF